MTSVGIRGFFIACKKSPCHLFRLDLTWTDMQRNYIASVLHNKLACNLKRNLQTCISLYGMHKFPILSRS